MIEKKYTKIYNKFREFFQENIDNRNCGNYTNLVCAIMRMYLHLFYKQEVKPNANI